MGTNRYIALKMLSSSAHSLYRKCILLYFLCQCQLLGIAAAYGDLQAVRYLLKEALVVLPTEPNDDNAAVVAAYFGHKDIVKELLDSLRGKPVGLPLPFLKLVGSCVCCSFKQAFVFSCSLKGEGLSPGKVRGGI